MMTVVAAGTNANDGNGESAAKNGKKLATARRQRRSPSKRAKKAKNDIDHNIVHMKTAN